jgi:undecaprenyl-diphosphatase
MEFLESQDLGFVNAFYSLAQRTPKLHGTVLFVTHLGDQQFLQGVVLGAILVLAALGRCRTAIILGLTLLGAVAIVETTKPIVRRDRPHLVAVPDSKSFPSGHAVWSAAVYTSLALAGGPLIPRANKRVIALGLSVFLAFLIGLSRLYLCQHYLTDVIAGWAAGWAWALICHALEVRWAGLPDR